MDFLHGLFQSELSGLFYQCKTLSFVFLSHPASIDWLAIGDERVATSCLTFAY
jgi:hypothetical protein